MSARLSVLVDGAPMGEDEARALWARFSAYMEENRGDLAGFAKQEGFASVHPATGAQGAALIASRTAPQRPYQTATATPARAPAQRTAPTPPGGPRRSNGPPKIQPRGQKPGK